jgi:hypothetical protein
MYIDDDLKRRTKEDLIGIIRHTHQALAALLWLVEGVKNLDHKLYEFHIEGSVPFDRADYVQRVLTLLCVDDIIAGKWLNNFHSGDSYGIRELIKCVQRSDIAESFDGGEKLFADLIADEDESSGGRRQ